MAKKRTTLDAVLPNLNSVHSDIEEVTALPTSFKESPTSEVSRDRPEMKQQSVYTRKPVYKQIRALAFEEEKKMHDIWLEALDLLFANRGLPSIAELIASEESH